jgi:hypothetical protein
MGAIFSNPPNNEQRDDTNTLPRSYRNEELVSIKLTCTDSGTFNGRSDQWITFKENTLSKAGTLHISSKTIR